MEEQRHLQRAVVVELLQAPVRLAPLAFAIGHKPVDGGLHGLLFAVVMQYNRQLHGYVAVKRIGRNYQIGNRFCRIVSQPHGHGAVG